MSILSSPVLRWALCAAATVFFSAQLVAATAPVPRVAPPPRDSLAPLPVVAWVTPPRSATIHFTLDGLDPTASDPVWPGHWLVTDPTTIRWRAFAPGSDPSPVVVGRYGVTFPLTTARPVPSPAAGVYPGPVVVTLASPTSGATIFYTLDGSLPNASGARATTAITLTETTTVRAIAVGGRVPVRLGRFTIWLPALMPSGIASATYTIQPQPVAAATPIFSLPAGTYDEPLAVAVTSATPSAAVYLTRDGSEPTSASERITGPIMLDVSATLRARAFAAGLQPSAIAEAAYGVRVRACTLDLPTGTFADIQTVTVSCPTVGAAIHATLDGTDPTESSPLVVGGRVSIPASAELRVRAFKPGLVPSMVTSASYELAVAAPVLSPETGTSFIGVLPVTASGATPDAVYRYTTDGSDPTETSPVFPTELNATTSLQVRGFRAGFTPSPVVAATYTFIDQPTASLEDFPLFVDETDQEQPIDGRVVLSHAYPAPVSVTVMNVPALSEATEDADFRVGSSASTITFPPGTTSIAITPLTILPDDLSEQTERITLGVYPADPDRMQQEGPWALANLFIRDTDTVPTVAFAEAASIADESSGVVLIPLRLSHPSGRPIRLALELVDRTARSGDDVVDGPRVEIEIPAGAVEYLAQIHLVDDALAEADETIDLVLDPLWVQDEAAVLSGILTHRLTIRSNEFANTAVLWFRHARELVATTNTDPAMASRVFALLGVAQRRAIQALAEQPDLWQSSTGVIAAASSAVLSGLYPQHAVALRSRVLAQTADPAWSGFADEDPLAEDALGWSVGLTVLAEARSDGAAARSTVTPPQGPGVWFPSWSYIAPPLRPYWGTVRPWFLLSGDQFRPAPPPAVDSTAFAAALAEVRAISDRRSDEELRIAGFWSDGPGTATPPGHWCAIAADLVLQARMGDQEAADLFSLLGATLMDAGIATWDSKFAYWSIRPYQVDRSITTPIGQPNFPSYVSGHSTFSGAAAEILAARFPAMANWLRAQADEAAMSRLYGGIHYRFDNDAGLALGRQIAAAALADVADGSWRREIAPRIRTVSPLPDALLSTTAPVLTFALADDDAIALATAVVSVRNEADVAMPVLVEMVPVDDTAAQVMVRPSTTWPDGIYRVRIAVADVVGNVGSGLLSFRIDTDGPPTITLTAPIQDSLVGIDDVVEVRGNVSQPVASLTVNGTSVPVAADLTFAVNLAVDAFSVVRPPLTLMAGINDIAVRAVDPAGQAALASVEVLVDDYRPVLRIESPIAGQPISGATVVVSGRVQDVTLGSVDTDNVVVTINGVAAPVRNGSFLALDVPVPADGTILAQATDRAGNAAMHSVMVQRTLARGIRARLVAGDCQEGDPQLVLPQFIQVQVTDAQGVALAQHPVSFHVERGDGTLVVADEDDERRRMILTDGAGFAAVAWRLGTTAGLGNHRLSIQPLGAEVPVTACASLRPGPPAGVFSVVDPGTQQAGLPGQDLPQPLTVWVSDAFGNPLSGIPVTFAVQKGGGIVHREGALGDPSVTVTSDGDGRAQIRWTVGSQIGFSNQRMVASVPEVGQRATFVASVVAGGPVEWTALSGVVLDTDKNPVPGVTLMIDGTTIGAVTDQWGAFRIIGAPPGHRHLTVQGTTANHGSTRYPTMGFEIDLVPGGEVAMPMPIYLPVMNLANYSLAGGDTEVVLPLPGVPGAEVIIAPHSTIRSDGQRGPVWMYTSPVNSLTIPMPPPGGIFPPIAATLQPSGTRLDPPARIRWPNMQGLPPGGRAEMLSFDHDLGQFVSQGSLTVSEDGTSLLSDPGSGLVKAGWHFPSNTPIPSADVEGTIPPEQLDDEEDESAEITALALSPKPTTQHPHYELAGFAKTYQVTAVLAQFTRVTDDQIAWTCTVGTFADGTRQANGRSVMWTLPDDHISSSVGDAMISASLTIKPGRRSHAVTMCTIAGETVTTAPGRDARSAPPAVSTPASANYRKVAELLRAVPKTNWKLRQHGTDTEVEAGPGSLFDVTSLGFTAATGNPAGIEFSMRMKTTAPFGDYDLYLPNPKPELEVHREHLIVTNGGFVQMATVIPVRDPAAPGTARYDSGIALEGPSLQWQEVVYRLEHLDGTAVTDAGVVALRPRDKIPTDPQYLARGDGTAERAFFYPVDIVCSRPGLYRLHARINKPSDPRNGWEFVSTAQGWDPIQVVGARIEPQGSATVRPGTTIDGGLYLGGAVSYGGSPEVRVLPTRAFAVPAAATDPVPADPTPVRDRWVLVADLGAGATVPAGGTPIALGFVAPGGVPDLGLTIATASVHASDRPASSAPLRAVLIAPHPAGGEQTVAARFTLTPQVARRIVPVQEGENLIVAAAVPGQGALRPEKVAVAEGLCTPFVLACPNLDIATPNGDPVSAANATNELVFDLDAFNPGTCSFTVESTAMTEVSAARRDSLSTRLQWGIPACGQVGAVTMPTNGAGHNVRVKYPSMPARHDDFGRKRISLNLLNAQGQPSGFSWFQDVEFFYHAAGAEGPRQHGTDPAENWFFYWSQIVKPRKGQGNPTGLHFHQNHGGQTSNFHYYWSPTLGGTKRSEIVIMRNPGSLAAFVALVGHEERHELDFYEVIWGEMGYDLAKDSDKDWINDNWEMTQYGHRDYDFGRVFETGIYDGVLILAWSDERGDKAGIDLLRNNIDINRLDWSDAVVPGNRVSILQDEDDPRKGADQLPLDTDKFILVPIGNNKANP